MLMGQGVGWDDVLHGPRVEELLDQLALTALADRSPRATSLGEQQRCSIARALVLDPALILADEPTAHQDAQRLRMVVDVLAEAAARGSCCVVATHSAEVMERASRVVDLGGAAAVRTPPAS